MRALRLSVLALLFLALVGCGGKTKDLIIGKWEPADADEKKQGTVEFTKDGEFINSGGPFTLKGKYKVLDDKTIEIEMDLGGLADKIPGAKMADKAALPSVKKKVTIKSISKNEMVVIGVDPQKKEKEVKLVRAK